MAKKELSYYEKMKRQERMLMILAKYLPLVSVIVGLIALVFS